MRFDFGDRVLLSEEPCNADPSTVTGIVDNTRDGRGFAYRLRDVSGRLSWHSQDWVRAWVPPKVVDTFAMGDRVIVKGGNRRFGVVDGMTDNSYCGEGMHYRARTNLGEEWFAPEELERSTF